MGLLKKLKSVFGSGSDERSGSSDETDVTVEYAPDAESEHAVKGTDQAAVPDDSAGDATGETADSAESDDTAVSDGTAGAEESTTGTDDDATTESAEVGDAAESPAVDGVKGIGPTYSERLGAAGIETVDDLATADPETVADAAEVSASRAEDWIERARSRT